ncbi:hypothetical protein [Microseira wollei]|uniref:hypothetical protein n=1 Tax=Microseira wollei TaxID=467598 RepID=UPI001CFD6CD6|nr:hypothetical protein [Microseira wollei]
MEKVKTNQVKTKPQYAWMNQYPSGIYSSALRNLALAVDRWRKGSSSLTRFKSKKRGESFTVLKKSGVYKAGEPIIPFTHRQVLHSGKKIAIPGLGEYRLKKRIPFLCSSQTFTISRVADRWFV